MNEAAIEYVSQIIQDPYPNPDYRVCHNEYELGDYFSSFNINKEFPISVEHLGADTESTPDKEPYCLTLSHTPGTGRLIYARDKPTIKEFYGIVSRYGLSTPEEHIHQLFHNFLHDEIQYGKLGMDIPIGSFTDTMVRAYNLCLGGGGDDDGESRAGRGSLGLKALAYRHLNVKMTSFRDTVYPFSIPKMLDWLKGVSATFAPVEYPRVCICGCPTPSHKQGKTGKYSGACTLCSCKRHKIGKPIADPNDKKYGLLSRKSNNLITAILKKEQPGIFDSQYYEKEEDDTESYSLIDPWKRIKDWHPHDRQFLQDFSLWPPPPASIADVPETELLMYACRDADVTLRLFYFMQNYHPWIFY